MVTELSQLLGHEYVGSPTPVAERRSFAEPPSQRASCRTTLPGRHSRLLALPQLLSVGVGVVADALAMPRPRERLSRVGVDVA